jgi:hypothetical protein
MLKLKAGMRQLKAIVAYVLTYGLFALVWIVFAFYMFAAYNAVTGYSLDDPLYPQPPPVEREWGLILGAIAFALFALAIRGFADWTRPWHERLPAPLLVAQPKDWQNHARSATRSARAGTKAAPYHEFWTRYWSVSFRSRSSDSCRGDRCAIGWLTKGARAALCGG